MFIAKISRYNSDDLDTKTVEVMLPTYTEDTYAERDPFHRAYADATMIVRGMSECDRLTLPPAEKGRVLRYNIESIERR
jgi:hypothetical protein